MLPEEQLPRFADFLLDLYKTADLIETDDFRSSVFFLLKRLIYTDSGWWGMFVSDRENSFVAQASLHNLPHSFVEDYAQIIDADELVDALRKHVGVTLCCNGDVPNASAEMAAFDRKYQLHSALSTCHFDRANNLYYFVTLFRNESSGGFTESERMLMELAMPHLIQAWSQTWRRERSEGFPVGQSVTAVVDRKGLLVEASPEFIAKLNSEFPLWTGHTLPYPIRYLIIDRAISIYRGKHIDLRASAAVEQSLITLRCSGHVPPLLSPREEAVAKAFSVGYSYKEIALKLSLSPSTVRSYIQQCYEKLGVKNKIELAAALTSSQPTLSGRENR